MKNSNQESLEFARFCSALNIPTDQIDEVMLEVFRHNQNTKDQEFEAREDMWLGSDEGIYSKEDPFYEGYVDYNDL